MRFAYFDTSALIKRYVTERGSPRVISLLRRRDLLSSALTPVEVISALSRSRRKRGGSFPNKTSLFTVSRIQAQRIRWELVELRGGGPRSGLNE